MQFQASKLWWSGLKIFMAAELDLMYDEMVYSVQVHKIVN